MYIDSKYPFRPCSMVETGSFPVHVGVYMGNGLFLHNSKEQHVELGDDRNFSGGRPIRLRRSFIGGPLEQQQTIQRAMSLIGKPYDLLTFNCEHAAYYATEGKRRSPQVTLAFLGALVLGGIYIANRQS